MPSGLNAEPGADAELPGGFGVLSQLAFGWPVRCVVAADLADRIGVDAPLAGAVADAAGRAGVAVGADRMPPANEPALSIESTQAAASVITGLIFRVFMEPPRTLARAFVDFLCSRSGVRPPRFIGSARSIQDPYQCPFCLTGIKHRFNIVRKLSFDDTLCRIVRLHNRHRRWIALLALLGIFFQQFAMAAYVCPIDQSRAGAATSAAALPPCHSAATSDKSRCHQHCHPLAQSVDHVSVPALPAALLPPTTWLRHAIAVSNAGGFYTHAIEARSTAPPLTIQHCTFQI